MNQNGVESAEPIDHYIDVSELEGLYEGYTAGDYRPVYEGHRLVGLHVYLYTRETI